MRFKIRNGLNYDYFIVEGHTIQECRTQAELGVNTRHWTHPWSEEV